MSIYQNIESNDYINSDARIIPECEECINCDCFIRSQWSSRGACRSHFIKDDDTFISKHTTDNAVRVFFQDDSALMCASIIDAHPYIARLCVDDDNYHVRGDYALADDGEFYSQGYARGNFYYCENCGVWVTYYSGYDRELRMCRSCAEDYRAENFIGGWHEHKGEYITIGTPCADNWTLGVEIEVEGDNDTDHNEEARYISEEFYNVREAISAFVFEWDCSLYNGFEIISQPHTLEAFEALDLERLEDILRADGYGYTDDADTTGLHVHFSTAWLGSTDDERIHTFARLVRFYDENFDLLRDITDRKDIGHSYANYTEHNCYDYDDDYDLVDATVDGTRYVAVNGNNFYRGTFEIRLCDGTICADKIRAWVDFNLGLFECLKTNNTTDISKLLPYLSDRAIDYFAL